MLRALTAAPQCLTWLTHKSPSVKAVIRYSTGSQVYSATALQQSQAAAQTFPVVTRVLYCLVIPHVPRTWPLGNNLQSLKTFVADRQTHVSCWALVWVTGLVLAPYAHCGLLVSDVDIFYITSHVSAALYVTWCLRYTVYRKSLVVIQTLIRRRIANKEAGFKSYLYLTPAF